MRRARLKAGIDRETVRRLTAINLERQTALA